MSTPLTIQLTLGGGGAFVAHCQMRSRDGGKRAGGKFGTKTEERRAVARAVNPETDASRFNGSGWLHDSGCYTRNLTWPRARMLRASSDGLIKPRERVRVFLGYSTAPPPLAPCTPTRRVDIETAEGPNIYRVCWWGRIYGAA